MPRNGHFFLSTVLFLAASGLSNAQPGSIVPPRVYELMINGESFLVEANRVLKLPSQRQPGVSYEIALRVAPTQRLKLNSVQFDYDWLAKVEDDRKRTQRTVRMTHELGFTMLITDLGQPLQAPARNQALKILTESLTETFRKLKVRNLQASQPRDRNFVGTAGRGVVVRYRDTQEVGHTCLVYVLSGPRFGVTCIVRYRDHDLDDIKTLLRKTLDSFRPIR